ncbi:cell adhesion molecule 2-like [Mytilus californianus]|uniref:cell adhesion molecule 2-like n=1 Tax=Mytilus californianus TaxID=6549 RepID=UPI0022451115|nr:cell adhesion molecule 2-like [Mytilus californianus]
MLRTPLNKSIKLDILYYPRVQFVWPKGPVSVGHNVNLSCSYYSNPLEAEISWTKNGQNIDYSHSNVTNIVVKSERNLTEIDLITEDAQGVTFFMFLNVTKTDEGAYTCNVTNTEGSASETVYLVVQDNDSETVSHSIPPYSGTSVKGFSMKEQMIYGVIVVIVEVVLIIISLVGHAYIRFRCIQTNYPVAQTDVRQISFEIEMRDITSTEDDVNEELRNQQLSTNHQNASVDDRQSDWSTTNSRSSSLHSNISQNMNEDDYLHPYHSFVQSRMDVHEYVIVDRKVNAEYEEIANVHVSKDQIRDYENTKL